MTRRAFLRAAAPEPPPARARFNGLTSQERIASILPRDYRELPLVQVDPEVVIPALERAVLEVLPEVVEAVLGLNALDFLVACSDFSLGLGVNVGVLSDRNDALREEEQVVHLFTLLD